MDYSYLENGLLQYINETFASSDLFYERLYYDTGESHVTETIQKNGNIAVVESEIRGATAKKRFFGFKYDHLNRMTWADYYDTRGVYDDYKIDDVLYDSRGNLTSLNRRARISSAEHYIDKLTYNYSSNTNKLLTVTDAATTYKSRGYNRKNTSNYTYDTNGNVKYDPSRGVTFTYNHLDLPVTADFGGGKTIEWLYDAGGGLLTKTVKQSGAPIDKRDYVGGIEYKDDVIDVIYHGEGRVVNTNRGATGTLNLSGTTSATLDYDAETINSTQIIQSPGNIDYQASSMITLNPGFEVKTGALFDGHMAGGAGGVSWEYQYTISDHLGNTRVVYADKDGNGSIDPSTEIIQSNDYYPFGLKMDEDLDDTRDDEAYQYNGIEYVEDHGLNYNMATYRCLDPSIGRWTSVDPKAESSMSLSPYNSMNGNPISNVDPNGDNPFLIGAAVGFLTNGIGNLASGQNFFDGAFQSIALGAIGGSFASGIGTLAQGFTKAGWSGLQVGLFQAGAHGLLGGALSDAGGGSFGSGFLSGAIASGVGSGIGSIKGLEGAGLDWALWGGGGISGGVGSVIGGGNFFDGARQGLITGGLNHAGNHANSLLSKPNDYIVYDGEYLNYYDDFGKLLYRVKANSGLGAHMNNPESQGIKFEGPIPEGGYRIDLKFGVPTEKSGGAWGDFGVRLNSVLSTKMVNRLINGRGGFFLHQDGNFSTNPGSAGCVAICGRVDTYRIWNSLKSYQAAGHSHIYVRVQY